MIDAPLAYAFGVGMVATVNPCGFAMLPAYLSFFLGLEGAEEDTRASVVEALAIGATMTAGFLVVFGVLGILLDGILSSVMTYVPWVTIVLGLGLVALGVALLRGRSFSLRLPAPRRGASSRHLTSVFLFGVSYALVSLSCTIPLFIAVVTTSSTTSGVASEALTFLAYGAGMGVVLVALTVTLALARHSLVHKLRRALPYVYRVSGALLVVAGLYVAYYGWYELRVRGGDLSTTSGPVQIVFDWNSSISAWIQRTGPVRIGIVLVAAIGVVAGPGHGSPPALGLSTPPHLARAPASPSRRRPAPPTGARPLSLSPGIPPRPPGRYRREPMFDELLAHPGVEESVELRSRFGFMAFHGGSLELGTDQIARAAARAGRRLGVHGGAATRPALARALGPGRPRALGRAAPLPRPRRGGGGRARLRTSRPVHHGAPRRPEPGPGQPSGPTPSPRPARVHVRRRARRHPARAAGPAPRQPGQPGRRRPGCSSSCRRGCEASARSGRAPTTTASAPTPRRWCAAWPKLPPRWSLDGQPTETPSGHGRGRARDR